MRRLAKAGLKKDFVARTLLPDWWEADCANSPALLQDLEVRIARFLDLPLRLVSDPGAALTIPAFEQARLRRVRDVPRERLAPAILTALRVAAAAVRTWADPPAANPPPPNGLQWRQQIVNTGTAPNLPLILNDLWSRGIPVIPLRDLPAPSFQGLACIVNDRPVIVVGHRHDEPGRVAFLLSHEAGHIAFGDCTPGQPIVDGEDEVVDGTDIETRADAFATKVVTGMDHVPELDTPVGAPFKELAKRAMEIERTSGSDASATIFSWARRTGDYASATLAVKALYRHTGAYQQLLRPLKNHIDLSSGSETDRELLRSVLL